MSDTHDLTKRERQVLDALYAMGPATAEQIRAALPSPPSNSATRALLRTLVEKGELRIEQQGRQYIYHPTVARDDASRGALLRVVNAFFEQSPLRAAMALVRLSEAPSPEEVRELEALIADAKERST